MKQNPNPKLSLIPLLLPLLLATLSLSTPVHGAVALPARDQGQTVPSTPHSRLQGRPGWNPLWGIGPVIPPAGSLDNVPVNNDPDENLNADPPADMDTDTDTGADTQTSADTDTDTNTNTNTGADLESTNAASDGGDTQAENGGDDNTSAN